MEDKAHKKEKTPGAILIVIGAFENLFRGVTNAWKTGSKKLRALLIFVGFVILMAWPIWKATDLYLENRARDAAEAAKKALRGSLMALDKLPIKQDTFDPYLEVKTDARIIDPKEIDWLQKQLNSARNIGLKLPENTQRMAVEEATFLAHELIKYETNFKNWPRSDTEVWNQKSGNARERAYFLANTLLKAGFRKVGLRLGVPPQYSGTGPSHAWVLVQLPDEEFIIDVMGSGKLIPATHSPLKDYFVVATVYPTEPTEKITPLKAPPEPPAKKKPEAKTEAPTIKETPAKTQEAKPLPAKK